VRERRRHSGLGFAGAAATIGMLLWAKAVRRPVDSFAVMIAIAASLVIIVNAMFLQSHSRPAPFIPNPTPPTHAAESRSGFAAVPKSDRSDVSAAQPPAARGSDPIAELISASVGSPARLSAVQRALSEFGYGQIKPSGTLDPATSAAIERFESEHKMQVTGRLSERLLRELSTLTGRRID
jgi:Putative peptidoglycan binding domain